MDQYNLYPRLVTSVGLEFLEPSDRDLLARLACLGGKRAGDVSEDNDGLQPRSIDSIISPMVYSFGINSYIINETGADYSQQVQSHILARWRSLGASDCLLGIIRSSQLLLAPRLIFELNGMYPEKGTPAEIGEIGKKGLSKKRVRKLLKSLRMAHQHYWPLDMLANIVEPCAKRTRQ